MERRGHVEREGPLLDDPVPLVVPRDRARVDERADGFLDEERIAAGAGDDAVAQLRRRPLERRLHDARCLVVREWLEHHLGEVHSRRLRLATRAEPLREEDQQRDAPAARRQEPEKIERCGVGVVQVLEDIEERARARERAEHVEDDQIHPALPFLRLVGRFFRPGQMEELREHRRRGSGVREAELRDELDEAVPCVGRRRVDLQLDEQRLDEPGVAPLVHP